MLDKKYATKLGLHNKQFFNIFVFSMAVLIALSCRNIKFFKWLTFLWLILGVLIVVLATSTLLRKLKFIARLNAVMEIVLGGVYISDAYFTAQIDEGM